jgi:hypothetical protein
LGRVEAEAVLRGVGLVGVAENRRTCKKAPSGFRWRGFFMRLAVS